MWEPRLNRVAAQLVTKAGARDGGSITWLSTRQGVLAARGRRYVIDGAINHESAVAAAIVDDKDLSRRFLEAAGVRTPRGIAARDAEEAVAWAETLHGPVVVKPQIGSRGRGVTVGLADAESIRAAYKRAAKRGRGVVVEEQIPFAEEYRCVVTPHQCFGVIRRVLPRVVGDGVSTVEELIDAKNIVRRQNPMLERLPIPKDHVVETVLAAQGLSLASVPAPEDEVLVRNVGGLSGGGEPHEVSDTVASEVPALAVAAAGALPGFHWGGIDVVTDERTGEPCVLEANINAGYGGATHPVEGSPRDVAGAVWTMRREHGSADAEPIGPVPLVSAAPRTVREHVGEAWPSGVQSALLGQVMQSLLTEEGWHVLSLGGVFHARRQSGEEFWFLRSGATTSDMLSPRRFMRRHGMFRRLLAEAQVLRPKGALVSEPADCRRAFGGTKPRLTLIPEKASWGASSSAQCPTTWPWNWSAPREESGTRRCAEPVSDSASTQDVTEAGASRGHVPMTLRCRSMYWRRPSLRLSTRCARYLNSVGRQWTWSCPRVRTANGRDLWWRGWPPGPRWPGTIT
ncbi:ATP-grasp domain-containing protein [Nesterenkonia sp. PF2B19]|uniref:ATP-grasp domain-containing protein n=1 Tax=Nesterenkonia sp. PF2B19 TaxID=1881858 RepID=UPI003FA55F0D